MIRSESHAAGLCEAARLSGSGILLRPGKRCCRCGESKIHHTRSTPVCTSFVGTDGKRVQRGDALPAQMMLWFRNNDTPEPQACVTTYHTPADNRRSRTMGGVS